MIFILCYSRDFITLAVLASLVSSFICHIFEFGVIVRFSLSCFFFVICILLLAIINRLTVKHKDDSITESDSS